MRQTTEYILVIWSYVKFRTMFSVDQTLYCIIGICLFVHYWAYMWCLFYNYLLLISPSFAASGGALCFTIVAFLECSSRIVLTISNAMDNCVDPDLVWSIFLMSFWDAWHLQIIKMKIFSKGHTNEVRLGINNGMTWRHSCNTRHNITKTRLYNYDPLKLHFYIVKLGFTGVYVVFLILLKT